MRIALVAMSGIRVVDEKLVELGLTLPGFVERSKVIASLPSLGLLTIAGIETKPPVEYEYYEIPNLEEIEDPVGLFGKFDAVAISTFSAQVNEAYDLGDTLKEAAIKVVMGGLHVTALPDEAIKHADAVIIGEGEPVWQNVIEDLHTGRLKKQYENVSDDFELSMSPRPRFDLLDIDVYNRITVQTSRGCPHYCTFCGSSPLLTKRYKQKPAEKILDEIDTICSLWEKPFIEFADDNTFVNHSYWKSLLPELAKRNIRWFTETDISIAQDKELLSLMKKAGCAQVLIGLESPTKSRLDGIELNANWKMRKADSYLNAIREIQSFGISVNGCFIFGLDSQDTAIFDEITEFVKKSKLQEVQITIQTPFPGTKLYSQLLKEGRMLDPEDWRKCTLFDVMYQPLQMSVQQLEDGFKKVLAEIYSPEQTALRRSYFKESARYYKTHH